MKLFFRKFGSGQPLIILHGLFGTSDNWNTLAKKYGEYFTTYTIDLRNHGQSPHSEIWNYDIMADDIVKFLETENISSAYIMGHSMGGKVAMFMAGKYPLFIEKLIVSDIAPKYYPSHHIENLDALNGMDLTSISSRKEAESYMKLKIQDVGTRIFLLKGLFWKDYPTSGKRTLAWRFNLPVITRDIENVGEALRKDVFFEGSTLFIRGEKSKYILDLDIDSIIEHFPNAILKTIEGAGHWIHADKPIEYFDTTLAFLL